MITYKHEKFIRDAVESVLMQKVNFDVELVVVDDNSSDKTEQIILDIARSHPNGKWIKYTKHETNMGMMPNFIWALKQCKGKYIALCEGDDYWTDSNKLQKQINFLEQNEEYVACFHDFSILNNTARKFEKQPEPHINTLDFRSILNNHFIGTMTLVFRNVLTDYPSWLRKIKSGDIALELLLADRGLFYYMKDNMAMYRVHDGGITATSDHANPVNYVRESIYLFRLLDKHFDFRYHYLFKIKSLKYFNYIFPPQKGFFNKLKRVFLFIKVRPYLIHI